MIQLFLLATTTIRGLNGYLTTALLSAPGFDRSKVAPVQRINQPLANWKYQALLPKMAQFDMKNPERVAAWSRLKKQELGR